MKMIAQRDRKMPRMPLRRVENAAGSLLHNEKPRRKTRKV